MKLFSLSTKHRYSGTSNVIVIQVNGKKKKVSVFGTGSKRRRIEDERDREKEKCRRKVTITTNVGTKSIVTWFNGRMSWGNEGGRVQVPPLTRSRLFRLKL